MSGLFLLLQRRPLSAGSSSHFLIGNFLLDGTEWDAQLRLGMRPWIAVAYQPQWLCPPPCCGLFVGPGLLSPIGHALGILRHLSNFMLVLQADSQRADAPLPNMLEFTRLSSAGPYSPAMPRASLVYQVHWCGSPPKPISLKPRATSSARKKRRNKHRGPPTGYFGRLIFQYGLLQPNSRSLTLLAGRPGRWGHLVSRPGRGSFLVQPHGLKLQPLRAGITRPVINTWADGSTGLAWASRRCNERNRAQLSRLIWPPAPAPPWP